jgi:hypothetical protein
MQGRGFALIRASAVSLALGAVAPRPAGAADVTADPGTYQAALSRLRPGDTLHLAGGAYPNGLTVVSLNGTPGAPITITGPTSGAAAVIQGRSCCNTISLTAVSYLVIENLEVDNLGLSVDALKAESSTIGIHHVTVENLYLHGFGLDQQLVGVNTKATAWDWVVRGNRIEQAGTGMYFGNSDGSAPFVRGTIEFNVVIDPLGYAVQVKFQNPRPSLPGMPPDGSSTIIRHNVFAKATNASMGINARPNLLVDHWPLSGVGQNDLYEIYGNFLYQNESDTETLFQGEGNVAFHDNLLVNTFAGGGVAIHPHNDVPKRMLVYHNTVYSAQGGIQLTGADTNYPQLIVANAIFAGTPLNAVATVRDNITDTFTNAALYLTAPAAPLGMLDLYPLAGQLSGAPVDLSQFQGLIDAEVDFNGVARGTTFRGAYEGQGMNPGWMPAESMITLVGSGGGMDGGVTALDASAPPDTGSGDVGSSMPDAGTSTTAGADGGPGTPDAGPMPDAATSTSADGGIPTPDGGPATPDGGPATPDGGPATPDGGPTPDAGPACAVLLACCPAFPAPIQPYCQTTANGGDDVACARALQLSVEACAPDSGVASSPTDAGLADGQPSMQPSSLPATPAATGGCGCTAAGGRATDATVEAMLFVLAAAVVARRRR